MDFNGLIEVNNLQSIVVDILEKIQLILKNKKESNIHRNIVDPFCAAFEISGFNLNYDEWLKQEITRQSQKTLSNLIGDFHQKVLGSIKGWENLERGMVIDLVCKERKIIAEVKNKHNTTKGSDKARIYENLSQQVSYKGQEYKGFTAYYVEIIPKNGRRYNKEFMPSNNQTGQRCQKNELIRIIDGYSFYALVTGCDNALSQIFDKTCKIINDFLIQNGHILPKKQIFELFRKAYCL